MIDHLLPLVKKPIRYTDHEVNLPPLKNSSVKVCLAFPDIYEIGMSNLGIRILYHIVNRSDIQIERVFAPWTDLGQLLKKGNIPLVSIETNTPVKDFDLIGFSIHTELSATTVLYMLDLAKIPIKSEDRDDTHPIVMAGGPVALNPLPLSPFIDAFVVGDGEEVILEAIKAIKPKSREENLSRLSKIKGVYVPLKHAKKKIIKRTVKLLGEENFPMPPLLPICELIHDRLAIEAARGCVWGCRFCQAGFVNRPLRIREPDSILRLVERGLRKTGWEEVSLLAFSILDYPNLEALLGKLTDNLLLRGVGVSLPSIRGELLTDNMLRELSRIRRSGLTFAPETGSARLRQAINKDIDEDRIFKNLKTAYSLGWRQIKFYFMIGLPGETDQDIDDLIKMAKKISKIANRKGVKLSIATFVPKPHTPFQWENVADIDEINEKLRKIRREVKRTNVKITYHNPELSYIEAIIARGDTEMSDVVEEVYESGGYFEDWTEHFTIKRWLDAFAKKSIDPQRYKAFNDKLPWDFIDIGVDKKFLIGERAKARKAEVTPNCELSGCQGCGACSGEPKEKTEPLIHYQVEIPKKRAIPSPVRYRLKYTIGSSYQYASHLDITRAIYRTFRRSDLPVALSQGFNPHPKVSYGPPKPVGVISLGEYLDFKLNHYYFGNIVTELNSAFPSDLRAISIRPIKAETTSLTDLINIHHYIIEGSSPKGKRLEEIKNSEKIILERKKDTTIEYIDIKNDIYKISYNGKLEMFLLFGKWRAKLWEIINYLYGENLIGKIKITRVDQLILSQGKLFTPLNI